MSHAASVQYTLFGRTFKLTADWLSHLSVDQPDELPSVLNESESGGDNKKEKRKSPTARASVFATMKAAPLV